MHRFGTVRVAIPFMAAAYASAGCFSDCTTNVVAAIAVEVRSAETGLPLADSATGFAVDGAYSDSLIQCSADSIGRITALCGAWERAGIYTVIVSRPGYQRWSQGNIVAVRRACHVQTQSVLAALEPVP